MKELYMSDIHLGNAYADTLTMIELLERAKLAECPDGRCIKEIVLNGDVLDGIEKYRTQSYKQYPQTLSLQRQMLKWLIELLSHEFPEAKIVLVLGNHEQDFRGVIFDPEDLQKIYQQVKVVEYYRSGLGMLHVHQLGRSVRFGGSAGWTPNSVMHALSSIAGYRESKGRYVAGLVTGHVHKNLAILLARRFYLILLPSFLRPPMSAPTGDMYYPAIVVAERNQDSFKFGVYSKEFNELDAIMQFNTRLVSQIQADHKKITSLDKVKRLARGL